MRILFATYAEKSHFHVMVPLAWALHNAGHEVRVASQPELTETITRAGLTAVPVGKNHSFWRANRVYSFFDPREESQLYDMTEPDETKLSWEVMSTGYSWFVRWWCWLVNDGLVEELTDYCRQWRPDLVIWEPITYAAPIAATASGAAHGRMMWCLDLFGRMRFRFTRAMLAQPPADRKDPLVAWLRSRAARVGVDYSDDMTTGQFTIDHTPPSFQLGLDLPYVPLRYVPYNDVAVVPDWLRAPPSRPRVCLTLGMTATERLDGYNVSVQDLLDSLADLDIELVATISPAQRERVRRVPPNTRVVPFVPLKELVPSCAAVINHGGNGTFYTTLAAGVPQLVLPTLFDEPVRAELLAEQGAGLMMRPSEVTGAGVRDNLLRLLGEPSLGANARRLRAEIAAMPTPHQVAHRLTGG
ncbi:activator-dependent family glycosyltransferase [Nonomuraea sp. NN258]|uniref:activator-dependent family glycosyltransferase n=1 Tax=Nonomuraea antri TaxID=2730852 RepID=UPI0015699AD1|nr:activator-dependent family glycosyltransferase [Nonomuraea antri]NRQ31661.1 activator-dependent family glycosyltransferase [Nonomuraea antri]